MSGLLSAFTASKQMMIFYIFKKIINIIIWVWFYIFLSIYLLYYLKLVFDIKIELHRILDDYLSHHFVNTFTKSITRRFFNSPKKHYDQFNILIDVVSLLNWFHKDKQIFQYYSSSTKMTMTLSASSL